MQEEINNPSLDDTMPEQMISLIEERLKSEKAIEHEGIWPVIWDFAGQAVYRAIHPIFMSPDAVYVLVLDLTKKLFETAHCQVKLPGFNEQKVAGPDSEDTNLDHIMRWIDSVHSLKQSDSLSSSLCKSLPPVILVGTHVDKLDGNAQEEKSSMWNELSPAFSEDFRDHITNNFEIDNTKAGNSNNQEDSQVVDLRKHIIALANELPHVKKKIPLSWLRVEKEIDKKSSQGENYVTKHIFKDQIAKQFCQFDSEGDFEELLHFLHARGTIVYHDCTNDEDGLVVMNPQWLVNILCRIITATIPNEFRYQDLYCQLRDHGILAEELIDEACKKLELEHIKEQLISIMKKFNLICQWRRKPDGKLHYYVPCMLTTKKDVKSIDKSSIPAPVYLTFNTKYVPSGLFSRLVVLFWEWASEMSSGKNSINCLLILPSSLLEALIALNLFATKV
ncbi:hypothetical protein OS493_038866 [Desmophyllum pertusum]|uniref:COR domain-containing protein n=1 Tax=Desmophyllum pertusum TaxID=174260 RepID=A0A9W9ZYD9_9CNID|nr:hypothetical protein OS493_038866 [Desmophyllum pertusum]